jgi:ATP-binding cassette, subfamily B, bacterial
LGENGSGKSTLAKILTGLYLADTGTVRWDGTDIAHINPAHLHERVAAVMQNPTQWPLTAADNIRIGRIDRPDPDNTNLHRVSIHSGVDTLINELPEGWNTVLTRHFHNSRDLSHGQWQRIGVARGLYRDAPLVVADEPTAAMDARAEHTVFTHLRNLNTPNSTQQRITVLVTHRLANIRHADLESGKNGGRRGSRPLLPRLGPLTPALRPPRPRRSSSPPRHPERPSGPPAARTVITEVARDPRLPQFSHSPRISE